VEAGTRRAGSGGTKANITTVTLPKFDGATSWAEFHRQFETAEDQNNWTQNEKAAHLFSVLQGHAADILHTVSAEQTYEDIVGAFRNRFCEHHLAGAYRSQLKARVHKSGETLQDFAAAVEQLPHRALLGLLVAFFSNRSRPCFR
jgi:hypothetical protein